MDPVQNKTCKILTKLQKQLSMNRMTELFVLRSCCERPFNFTDQFCLTRTDRIDQMQPLLSIYASSYMVKLEPLNSISCCQGTGTKCKCNFSWGCLWGKSSKRWCETQRKKDMLMKWECFIHHIQCMYEDSKNKTLDSFYLLWHLQDCEIYVSGEVQMKLVLSCRIDVSLEWF